MGVFYKAVREDGKDFFSETIDYAAICGTGEWLPEKSGDNAICCTDGVYHASTSKADTLIGGSWPCRLFEVEGESVAEEENKRGFLTLKVIRELPAWEALGPNGQEVAALIEKAATITLEQAELLNAAWDAAWDKAGYAARRAARSAAWSAAGGSARGAAWSAAGHAAWDTAWDAAWDAARGEAWSAAGDAVWSAAGYADRYAAWALVVKDLITPKQFDLLYAPWASVMDVLN